MPLNHENFQLSFLSQEVISDLIAEGYLRAGEDENEILFVEKVKTADSNTSLENIFYYLLLHIDSIPYLFPREQIGVNGTEKRLVRKVRIQNEEALHALQSLLSHSSTNQ